MSQNNNKLSLKEKILTTFLTNIIYFIFRLLGLTYRHQIKNLAIIEEHKKANPPGAYLLAIWHQNIFAGMQTQRMRHVVMASPSKDGEFAAATLQKLGHQVVRGSSNKRSHEALIEMIAIIKKGIPASLSIDGPRGPLYEVKAGVIEMARKTQTPIIAMAPIPQKYWSFKSWDQFRLPKPFTTITVVYGNPIFVPLDVTREEFESYKIKLKEELFRIEQVARAN